MILERAVELIRRAFIGDSMISSMKLFAIMVTVSIMVEISDTLLHKHGHDTSTEPTQVIQMIYMVIGCLIMIQFCWCKNRMCSRRALADVVESRIDAFLITGALTIFYILTVIFSILYLFAAFQCFDVFSLCAGHTYLSYITDNIYIIFRSLYLGVAVIFCIVFRHASFISSGFNRHSLMILQATNVALWFDILITESSFRFDQPLLWQVDRECQQMFANDSLKLECVNRNTTLYLTIMHHVCPHFYQFPSELTFLMGERLLCWYVQSNLDGPDLNDRYHQLTDRSMEHNDSTLSRRDYKVIHDSGDHSALSSDDECQSFFSSSRTSCDVDMDRSSEFRLSLRHSFLLKSFLLASLLINIFYGLLSVLIGVVLKIEYRWSFFVYGNIYWTLMILSIFLGYHWLRDFNTGTHSKGHFHGLQILLVLSSIGQFAYRAISLYSLFGGWREIGYSGFEKKFKFNPITYGLDDILTITYVYMQVSFCFHLERITSSTHFSNPSPNSVASLKIITLHMTVVNITQWINVSFTTYNNPDNFNFQKDFFDNSRWRTAMNAVLPIEVFFWFNSGLIFVKSFLLARKLRPAE